MTRARELWTAFEQEKTKRICMYAKKFYSYDYTTGMDMNEYLDDMEAMRRQMHNMDDISDAKMMTIILQGVAYVHRGVVSMIDQDVRDGKYRRQWTWCTTE
ncbi:hypothetical protein PHMEG_00027758 [Phytophthora megakarya]|uniref:Uncharacterized protein n=1 Tax=Phytophthora megakarya TaxID=4795 RepID=A0A225V946_9STRA|nr:hypothetical protein PHMEG_00027758 [Phytophthora megakarya]